MRMPREFYLPKSAVKVSAKNSGAVAYVWTKINQAGQSLPCAALFAGKATKPIWRFQFLTLAQREQRIKEGFAAVSQSEARKRATREARKGFANPYKSGDLFRWTWGYDQTNVNYFEVIESKGRYVTVREIESKAIENGSTMTGKCIPLPGQFRKNKEPKRCLAGDGSIRIEPWARGGRAYYLKPEKMIGTVPVYGADNFSTYA